MRKALHKSNHHDHPSHTAHLKKLNRIIGQLQGVQRMIQEQRYCPEILMQTRAAASALRAVELQILKGHLKHCVRDALSGKSGEGSHEKVHELIQLLDRF